MPELPEVETVVRGLQSQIVGETFADVEILHPTLIVQGNRDVFREKLQNRTIRQVTRRAKFLCFHLAPTGYLLGHLRMTGKFVIAEAEPSTDKHQRVRFRFQSGRWMIFSDVRCFGTLEMLDTLEDSRALANLGLEPLASEFTPEALRNPLQRTSRNIKSVLLDQRVVVGIGNIYASEILYRIGVHPERPAQQVRPKERKQLVATTKSVLQEAIAMNGTSISDFRRVDDKTGEFQAFLRVYGKDGSPCDTCGTPIQRIVQQQRSSFFCPTCQQ
ncbi:MAG: bifunctional DNA-formamidopyrimidine glycosylase/DNA-(apurinic or apyrimidinic site) lyase [SAR324 cluster bacterium]|nr:bifunctional DNA-formamidopyrimidine glycosylase/DNA-(apurinic or apyrimidinic site) lyase [SAR324 cluster bacterium]